MNKKQLKQLAEQHFYLGRKLTAQEKFLLENSKYKNVIKNNNTRFGKIMEQYSDYYGEEEPKFEIRTVKRKRMFTPGIDRNNVKELIDEVEEKFNLGIENPDFRKYSGVNMDELKLFIQQYADKNIMSHATQHEINEILDSDSAITILHKLYSLA